VHPIRPWVTRISLGGGILLLVLVTTWWGNHRAPQKGRLKKSSLSQREVSHSWDSEVATRSSSPEATVSPQVGSPPPSATPQVNDKETVLSSIHSAAITYDPASLPQISPFLSSPDPEIRAAAIDGIMLLGDAAGSPLLRQAAAQTGNPAEAADLRAKADYLELPPAKLLTPEKIKLLKERNAAWKNAKAKNGKNMKSVPTTASPPPSQ